MQTIRGFFRYIQCAPSVLRSVISIKKGSHLFALALFAVASVSFSGSALSATDSGAGASFDFSLNPTVRYDHVVVRFREGSGVSAQTGYLAINTHRLQLDMLSGMNTALIEQQLQQVSERLSLYGLPMFSLFANVSQERLDALRKKGEANTGWKLADLSLFYEIPVPVTMTHAQIRQWVDFLNALPVVEMAYAVPVGEQPVLSDEMRDATIAAAMTSVENLAGAQNAPLALTPDFSSQQGYLFPAPQGIDAHYAWTQPGGKGNQVKIIDVEQGMNPNHEDFPELFLLDGFLRDSSSNHGTAVLGVMGAKENGTGVTGIVPQAQIGFVSWYNRDTANRVADSVTLAAEQMGPGGVVLIEVHRSGPVQVEECSCNQSQCNYIAVEYWDADYEAIRTAVANGVVVVQAAGNGSANFDDPVYGGRFDRSVRDSGAIIVSGSGSTLREPQCWSNYGERVDLHAWGTSVVTTGYGDLHTGLDASDPNSWYTRGFSGSSSASPIAAGAVASMLGVFYEETGRWLNPAQVRELLVQNGTAQTAGLTRDIGVLPDLRRAIGTMINNKAALIAELDGEQDEVCVSYEATLAEHLAAGRAYTQSSGFWWAVTKTYYAVGSNEKLGTLASTVVSLVETEQGYQVGVCSDQDDDDDNGEEGVCITAANLTHISEGRAISCGNSFMPSACAVGSNDNLGYASQWFNQTSSVQETSANYWVKVASCP